MSSTVLVILVAGGVISVFLLLAALAWGIRTRRGEENFTPAPGRIRKTQPRLSDSGGVEEAVPDWMAAPKPAATVSLPSGTGSPSAFGDILRTTVPQLSTFIDLGKLIQHMQASGETMDNPEERNAALRKALDQMIAQQPDNAMLRQWRYSIGSVGESEDDEEYTEDVDVEVVRVGGRNVIRAGGTEYYSLMDIPDPDVQEEARRLLLEIDDRDPS
jgi:hypothetical protein